jgi:hypothetical protein
MSRKTYFGDKIRRDRNPFALIDATKRHGSRQGYSPS